MSARATVQSIPEREAAIGMAGQGQALAADPAPPDDPTAWKKSDGEGLRDRCSPDPCQHTDRYRLATPSAPRL